MNNLGYFQLKSTIGIFKISIKQSNKHKYRIKSIINDNKPIKSIVVDSLNGVNLEILVDKIDNGDDDIGAVVVDGGYSIWNSLNKFLGLNSSKSTDNNTDETINVFSVCTGSVYERFLRIMMLSVMKHTKKHVKFWLLRNFLSEKFIVILSI